MNLLRTLVLLVVALPAAACWASTANAQSTRMGYSRIAQQDGGVTTVFYPTSADEQTIAQGPFHLSWAEDAAPNTTNGRLVVISHGSGGSPWVHTDLARTLVQHGFVVALPQHAGDNYLDSSEPGPTSWKRRPLEISQTIDRLATDSRFSTHLRFDSVGVFGGSAGGHTALTLAGGEWSPSQFRDHCLRNIEQDFSSCVGFFTLLRGDWLDGLKLAAARFVIQLRFSDNTIQRHIDQRIKAAVAMVPFAADFSPESLRNPAIPVGLIVAERDINQKPAFHVKAIQAACFPRCEIVATLAEGGHGAMLSPMPPFEAGSVSHHLLSDPPTFDRARVLPLLHEAIATFFLRTLAEK